MSLRWFYQNASGGISEMVGKVQFTGSARQGTDGLATNAEEGTVARSKINYDDPEGTFEIAGHRKVYAAVSEAEDDGFKGVIWVGYTFVREVVEGSPFDGAGRVWEIELDDLNTIFDRRIEEGNDANRGVESDVERMQWLFSTAEFAPIIDDTYLSTASPVQMSAADYRGQKVSQVVDDCAQQSGKNWWVNQLINGNDVDADPTLFSLWYGHGTLEEFVSPIRLSNVPSEIDGVTTFVVAARETKLKRDPSRVFSGVRVNYDGGHVYVQRPSTVEDFARRDTVAQAENVKTAARARSRAQRYLNDMDTEEDRITTSIIVPAAQVNDLRWGHYVPIQLSWAPGYETFVWMRVANRTVRPLAPGVYEIAVELVGPSRHDAPAAASGVLYMTRGFGGPIYFAAPGDTPPPGWLPVPTNSFLTPVTDPSPPDPPWPYLGWDVTGTGTLDLRLDSSVAGVLIDNIGFTVTVAITLNGAIVASESEVFSGFLQYLGAPMPSVVATGLAVAPGDEIRALITCSPPTMPFFRTPAGTGQDGEGLYVTGGSLS